MREAPRTRPSISGETVLSFKDPDGMRLALVAIPGAESASVDQWRFGGRSRDLRLAQRNLLLRDDAPTGAIVTGLFGFSEVRSEIGSAQLRPVIAVDGHQDGSSLRDAFCPDQRLRQI